MGVAHADVLLYDRRAVGNADTAAPVVGALILGHNKPALAADIQAVALIVDRMIAGGPAFRDRHFNAGLQVRAALVFFEDGFPVAVGDNAGSVVVERLVAAQQGHSAAAEEPRPAIALGVAVFHQDAGRAARDDASAVV